MCAQLLSQEREGYFASPDSLILVLFLILIFRPPQRTSSAAGFGVCAQLLSQEREGYFASPDSLILVLFLLLIYEPPQQT